MLACEQKFALDAYGGGLCFRSRGDVMFQHSKLFAALIFAPAWLLSSCSNSIMHWAKTVPVIGYKEKYSLGEGAITDGYSSKDLGNNTYAINVMGRENAPESWLRAIAMRRASELAIENGTRSFVVTESKMKILCAYHGPRGKRTHPSLVSAIVELMIKLSNDPPGQKVHGAQSTLERTRAQLSKQPSDADKVAAYDRARGKCIRLTPI